MIYHPLIDGCPNCVGTYNRPKYTEVKGTSVIAWYRCDDCRWSWRCWWALDTIQTNPEGRAA